MDHNDFSRWTIMTYLGGPYNHHVDHNDWPIVGMAHNDYDSGLVITISPYSTQKRVCVGYPTQIKSTRKT